MEKYLPNILALLFAGGVVLFFNHGIPSLDGRFHYSVENARYFLSSLSAEESQRHFWGECADLFLFIPAYGAGMFVLACRNREKTFLMLLASLAVIADIIETSTIIYCLKSGELAPNYLPLSTTTKWLAIIFYVLLFLGGLRRRQR